MITKKHIEELRDAYLRLEYIYTMNELCEDQEWIEKFMVIAKRKIGRSLKALEPKRRLPSVLHDTKLGRSIKESRIEQKQWAACEKKYGKHDLKTYKAKGLEWLKGDWKQCSRCKMTTTSFEEQECMCQCHAGGGQGCPLKCCAMRGK